MPPDTGVQSNPSVLVASTQTPADTGPFLPYALHAVGFIAGLYLLCALAVLVPRAFRNWRNRAWVVNQATALTRGAVKEEAK